jgi:copine 5/8/9
VKVLDYENNGKHAFIGSTKLSINDLLAVSTSCSPVVLTRPPSTEQRGSLSFANAHIVDTPTFLDYLRSGLEIDFSVAIDFTLSNGSCENQNSLHYSGGEPTQYEQAIRGVGAVLDHYNPRKCDFMHAHMSLAMMKHPSRKAAVLDTART